MEKRPFKPTQEDKRRIRIRTQLLGGYYTGRAIAVLIACVLLAWFLLIQAARGEIAFCYHRNGGMGLREGSPALLTAGRQPPTMGWVVAE